MGTVDKGMVHIDGKGECETAFAGYNLSGGHQRIAATVSCLGKRIGYRGEIHFGPRHNRLAWQVSFRRHTGRRPRVCLLSGHGLRHRSAQSLRGRECARYRMSFRERLSEK